MRTDRKVNYSFMLLCYLVATLCFTGVTTGTSDAETQGETKDRKVVARVNGTPIYDDQLTTGVDKGLRRFKKYGMRKESPDLVKRLKRKALDQVIGQELIYQESQKMTIDNLEEKIEQKLQTMRRRYQSQEQFENYLRAKNLAMKGLRESLRKSIYANEYLKNQGISEPEIPDEGIRTFYENNPDSYYREETIKVSHILIKMDESAAAGEKEGARKKAGKIREEILGGKDFAETAKQYSDCNSASGGGSLGYIKRGYMPEEFGKVAFALEKGAVSDVVETKFGCHIITVSEKTPRGIAPYGEVKNFIKKFLQQEESKKRLAAHIAKLKEKAKIEILLNES